MKEIWKIITLIVAFYLLTRYENSRGKSLDWTDIFGNTVVVYLFLAAFRGL